MIEKINRGIWHLKFYRMYNLITTYICVCACVCLCVIFSVTSLKSFQCYILNFSLFLHCIHTYKLIVSVIGTNNFSHRNSLRKLRGMLLRATKNFSTYLPQVSQFKVSEQNSDFCIIHPSSFPIQCVRTKF